MTVILWAVVGLAGIGLLTAIKEGLKVIEAWGFKYKTIGFQWVKQNRKGELKK